MPAPPDAAESPLTAALAACDALRPWMEGAPGGRLWVAFSGGADSTALLHGLHDVPGVRAVHVDHGLHPDSTAWACHCARQAASFGTAFECHRVRPDAAGNREAAARRARYGLWRALLRPGDVLALAHHADDQAETRLWQVFTGRAPGGMPAARMLGAGRIVRPLLPLRRSALRTYAVRHGLRWVEDPSNADQRQDRGYIRHQVLPAIEARFPAVVAALGGDARPGAPTPVPPLPAAAANGGRIEAWLAAAGLPLGRGAMAQIERQSLAAADRNPAVAICPGTRAWRYRGVWHLVRDEAGAGPQQGTAVVVGTETALPTGVLGWQTAPRGLPPGLRMHVRARRGGERLRPAGRNLSKTVKALLRERLVPPWHRPAWPLLYAEGATDPNTEGRVAGSKLLAVADIAVDASAAVCGGLLPTWRPHARTLTQAPGSGAG